MYKTPSVDAKQQVEGKKIVNLTAEGLELEDGTKLTWKSEGGVGLDGGWYEWLVIRVNEEKIFVL